MDAKGLGELPAYPQSEQVGERGDYRDVLVGGMTKREVFAMHNCAALLGGNHPCGGDVAGVAVQYADALLAKLAKEPT